jgi:hypothetical protein
VSQIRFIIAKIKKITFMSRLYLLSISLFLILYATNFASAQKQQVHPYQIPCEELMDHPEFAAADTLPVQVPVQPETLAQALTALDNLLNPYQKRFIACLPEGTVRETLHYSFGTWIRNVWGLWDATPLRFHFLERGVLHPDDMSSIILTSYYRKLTGKPLNVQQQIDYFYNYWLAQGVNIDSLLQSAQKNKELIEEQRNRDRD